MHTVQEIGRYLDEFAPSELAEDWDNVGLLVGDPRRAAERIMVCLTVTRESAAEAVSDGADLIVAHHPLPFHPLRRITAETVSGQLLLQLIEAGVAVFSPHTAFDSAELGINQRLAEGLGLREIRPLVAAEGDAKFGAGRWGRFPEPISFVTVTQTARKFLGVEHARCVGDPQKEIAAAAVACGSAGQFLADARAAGCELLVTGETSFHTCLEAAATDVCLLLPGHYASERFAVEQLAAVLQDRFADLHIWASHRECDPIRWV